MTVLLFILYHLTGIRVYLTEYTGYDGCIYAGRRIWARSWYTACERAGGCRVVGILAGRVQAWRVLL